LKKYYNEADLLGDSGETEIKFLEEGLIREERK
jgi:hypothetical protein